jgi:hypothetical protein
MEIKKKEELDKILSKSKSVSFYSLLEIGNVNRIIICALCLTVNNQIMRIRFK